MCVFIKPQDRRNVHCLKSPFTYSSSSSCSCSSISCYTSSSSLYYCYHYYCCYYYYYYGSKSTPVVVLVPVVIINGLRAAAAWNVYVTLAAPTTTVGCISSWHAYSYIQQSGCSVKSMNAKNTKNHRFMIMRTGT